MKRIAGLLLLVLLLAGCGANQGDQQRMDAKFQRVEYQISARETIAAPSDPSIVKLTHKYVALVDEYASDLGPKEAKRRLQEKGDDIGQYCLACAAVLYDAAKKY
jgi:hypothetical protein